MKKEADNDQAISDKADVNPLFEIAKETKDKFRVGEIWITRDENHNNEFIAKSVNDKFINLENLISEGKQTIMDYRDFLKQYVNSEGNTLDAKKYQLSQVIRDFEELKWEHDIHNRFNFISDHLLFDGKTKAPLYYNDVHFSMEINNELRELFRVRYEIFEKLEQITRTALFQLDFLKFKNSKLKLTSEGRYLLWEFILGITNNENLLVIEYEEKKILEKQLFDLFGVPSALSNRGKEIGNIKKRPSPKTTGLRELAAQVDEQLMDMGLKRFRHAR